MELPRRNPHYGIVEENLPLTTLATSGHALDLYSLCDVWAPYFVALQAAFDHLHPNTFTIAQKLVCFVDSADYKRTLPIIVVDEFENTIFLKAWVDHDGSHGNQISLAIMCTRTKTTVGKTHAEASKELRHVWILMTVHPPPGTQGKTIAVFDCDVSHTTHSGHQAKAALGFKNRWVTEVKKRKRRKNNRVWPNVFDAQFHNTSNDCVQVTVQWLKQKVETGFNLEFDSKGVLVAMPGFELLKY
ncbi:hypothetical protein B0H19DRAFT_1156051 [Mycena capillaripes]|nr:hypothetical protein B0H19DRAFT_1156051 [Mycena capillaripes]